MSDTSRARCFAPSPSDLAQRASRARPAAPVSPRPEPQLSIPAPVLDQVRARVHQHLPPD